MKTALFSESGTIAQSGHKHKPDCARPTDMTDFDKESQVNSETESRTTGNTEPEPQHEPKPRTRAESGPIIMTEQDAKTNSAVKNGELCGVEECRKNQEGIFNKHKIIRFLLLPEHV